MASTKTDVLFEQLQKRGIKYKTFLLFKKNKQYYNQLTGLETLAQLKNPEEMSRGRKIEKLLS